MRHILIVILLLAWATAAAAQPYERFRLSNSDSRRLTSRVYERCMDRSRGITVNMRNCSGDESNRLDRLLNATYRATMARLPDQVARLRLRNFERRWLATRWDHCDREVDESGEAGGTIALIMLDACGVDEIQRRIAWLERYGR